MRMTGELFRNYQMLAALVVNAVIIQSVANMHSRPDTGADVVSQAILGAPVSVLERQNGWARIQTVDQYAGWVQGAALRDGDYGTSGRLAQVSNLFAHIYAEPSVTRRAPFLTAPFEARLEITGEPEHEDGRWLRTRLPDGREGWVQRGDIEFDPKPLTAPATVRFARQFLGLPYTWGGTSSYGYDCSGFTQMLCRRRGISIPRDADPQAHWEGMQPVKRRANLRPGDLLYFGAEGEKITHTGMYIGAGQFIHATTSGRPVVQISRLAEPLWRKSLVAMRRPR